MRMSKGFGKTLREAPADAEMASHRLLIRANYIRPLSAGIYTFMPLGFRVIRKIWAIMSDELDAIGPGPGVNTIGLGGAADELPGSGVGQQAHPLAAGEDQAFHVSRCLPKLDIPDTVDTP